MKQLFIVANWKSNKTESEAKEWFENFQILEEIPGKEIILCPSYTLLPFITSEVVENKLPVKVGAQDISPFASGAYTGEVYGGQIKEFADFVIINHSERRKYFGEDDKTAQKKVGMAKHYGLISIFCVQGEESLIPNDAELVAYEPVFAIGTGKPDTAENANLVAGKIKEKGGKYVLYGGSVSSKNVNQFTKQENINGVLVGGASLDPLEFFEIIKNA